jgi:hypothetical protein
MLLMLRREAAQLLGIDEANDADAVGTQSLDSEPDQLSPAGDNETETDGEN